MLVSSKTAAGRNTTRRQRADIFPYLTLPPPALAPPSPAFSAAVEKAAGIIADKWPEAKTWAVKCDVSKEADTKNMVDGTVERFGRLDVLVRRPVAFGCFKGMRC